MVDVTHKTCEHDGCKTRPNYNYPDKKVAKFCVNHKMEGMVDVKHKPCEHDGCKKQPTYNHPGEKIGKFCVNHKMEGMMDVKNNQHTIIRIKK